MSRGFSAREALIPMVAGTAGGTLARIAADGEWPPPHAAQLDRTVSDLLETGLYQAGQQGQAAAQWLALPSGTWRRRTPAALHVVNPGDVIGLAAENSVSAELGMALALLMFRSQSAQRCVLATGALGLTAGGSDVPVLPIHHLSRKLRLVTQHFMQPGTAPAPRWFITPLRDPDGVGVQDRYRVEADALGSLGVELRPVGTLAEAAQLVGATRQALTAGEQRTRQALGALAALLAIVTGVKIWSNAPIELSFAPVVNADGSISVTPARSRMLASGVQLLAPCRVAETELPAFPVGEHIAVRLRTGRADDFTKWFGGYQHVLVAVSASSGAKVLPPPTVARIVPGAVTGYLVDVRPPAEETMLIWLVKRGAPFDTAALDKRLSDVLEPLGPSQRISAARNLLNDAASGVLLYSFRSVASDACT